MRNLLSLIFLALIQTINAQTIISGKLLDDEDKPISNVSVSYKLKGGAAILGFTRSDSDGLFSLAIKVNERDSVQLDFQHINYAHKSALVANKTADYVYQLKQETRQIREVKAENIPIYRSKDTINYDVGTFKSAQDHVIADVIKKLPGIEMLDDQILYQGKPIHKYMVNNLDLMEGRYGVINNNLPADAVAKVQIVENDQPIKILDSLVFSNEVSLNIALKRFTTTGSGKIGVGYKPELWDLNLTPMTFGQNFQIVNTFQTNNSGRDVSKELHAFYTSGGLLEEQISMNEGNSFLTVRDVASPDFDEKKWLDNKIFMISSNAIKKFQNGLELKGNVSYYHDTQKRKGFTATKYFTTDDVIYSNESLDNNYQNQVIDFGMHLEKNEKNIYLRNSTQLRKTIGKDVGNLLFNDSDVIDQRKNHTDQALLNSLSIARLIGKQLININSVIRYNHTPQQLLVSPGQFEGILNEGRPYDQMQQQVVVKKFSADQSLSFMRKVKHWTFAPAIAVNYEQNDLNTDIQITDNNSQIMLGEEYINDTHNSQLKLALRLAISWEKAKWKINVNTPYNLYYFHMNQQEAQTEKYNFKQSFNPSAGLTYLLNSRNEFSTSFSKRLSFGDLNNLYSGYIISEYRNMRRYNARLLQTNNKSGRVEYNYKNSLKASFANLSYNYTSGQRDYIFSSIIDESGRYTTSIVNQQSANKNQVISGGVSRFFPSIKTIAKLNMAIRWGEADYLLNGLMDKQKNTEQSGSFEIINSLSSVILGDYKTTYGRNNIIYADNQQVMIYNNHYLNLTIFPAQLHSIILSNTLYTNNIKSQKKQHFLDLTYRYHIKRWNTDIEVNGQNLLNKNQYVQQFSSTIELIQTAFELRPRQFIISTRFKF